jgi:hypothetical protein
MNARNYGDPLPPNLFLIGAPKCGTTAMSHYLAQHPKVYMTESSGVKEPYFFSTDVNVSYNRPSNTYYVDEYCALFEGATSEHKYLGEASAPYLYSKAAVPRLLSRCVTPRLIVMLRNPLDLAKALHNTYTQYTNETLDFERAWRLQDQRRQGKYLPCPFTDGTALQYGAMAKLGEQMQRLFTHASREQVHVIIYDDFAKDAKACYEALLAWLDLPPAPSVNFERINPGRNYRFKGLEQSLRHVRRLRETLHFPAVDRIGVKALIDRFNVTRHYRPLRPRFRQELKDYFREDVKLLSDIIGRDLTHWTA